MSLLQKLHEAADYWQPYLDQLIARAEQLDKETRQKLCLWYRVMADVHRSLENEARAIQLYELGILADSDDDGERRRCMRGVEDTHAYFGANKRSPRPPGKTYCDQVSRRLALSLSAHFLLAHAYVLLEEYDGAREVCYRGLAIEPDPMETDYEEIEQFTHDRERLQDMLASVDRAERDRLAGRSIEKAEQQMKAGGFSNALLILNELLARVPGEEKALFMRCRCHLAELQIADRSRT